MGELATDATCRTSAAALCTLGQEGAQEESYCSAPLLGIAASNTGLAAQMDPNLAAKSMGKIEDDVPALFKRLRYPFGISKSALFAVGSPHTWPGLLAALTWLVELLNYEEKAVRGLTPASALGFCALVH